MIGIQQSFTKPRIFAYILILAVLSISRVLLNASNWMGTPALHSWMELTAALLALFTAALASVRFYTRRNSTFLLIGLGFLGAGFIDMADAVLTNPNLIEAIPLLESLPTRTSLSYSPLFLSFMMVISWLSWQRREGTKIVSRRLLLFVLILLISLTLHHWVFLPEDRLLLQHLRWRWSSYVAAAFLGVALLGYFHKGHWRSELYEHWLIMALLFSFVAEAAFLPYSKTFFDPLFDAAIILKQLSYICMLTGLFVSIYSIFREAARSAARLAEANEALQHEVAKRKRFEAAAQEQRNLAEALRKVGIALGSELVFDELLEDILDQIGLVLPYATANVMLVEGDNVNIVCTRGYERQVPLLIPTKFPISNMPSLRTMIETGAPLIVPDTYEYDLWTNAESSPHVRSWAGAPISVRSKIVAFLSLNNSQPNFYQPKDASRLADFAVQASIAFENSRLYEEVKRRVAELTTINDITQVVASSLNLQETLTVITERTTKILGVAATSVVLHDKEEKDLVFAAASGEASDFILGKRLAMGQGILGWVALHGEPLLVPDTAKDGRHFGDFDAQSGFRARSIVCVPLLNKGQSIGAIEAMNKEAGPFNEEDVRLLQMLARPAAAAIENAQLFERAQQEIHERKRAEIALEKERVLLAERVKERTADLSEANAELERAARMKDEFLASMSHELRTPLNAILGISEMLQEGVYGHMNDDQADSLRNIEESGRHLLALINDILDLSKIEVGKLELEMHPVMVDSICEASLRLIKQDAHKKRLQVNAVYDSAVQMIAADERRLKQILVNLLSNAVKFTPKGGQIGLTVEGDEKNMVLRFTIWDTGIGIAATDLQRLFRPFVQLDSGLSREYQGTGLGLSLVYRMAELHGGGIIVKSALGKGSQFTVSLPWLPVEDEHDPLPAHDTIPQDLPPTPSVYDPHIAPVILLVEDNETNIKTVSGYLRAKGFHVVVARNGHEGIERTREERPDIILMDIQMPILDGLEATRRIRKHPELDMIPIIALTALAMPGDKERCIEAGVNAYISKPVSLRGLLEVIESYLPMETNLVPHD